MLEPIETDTDDDYGLQLTFDRDHLTAEELEQILSHHYPDRDRANLVIAINPDNHLYIYELL